LRAPRAGEAPGLTGRKRPGLHAPAAPAGAAGAGRRARAAAQAAPARGDKRQPPSRARDVHPRSDAATTSRRDVKHALLQLGRARPDILLLLPAGEVAALAALPLPLEERPERKSAAADARLKASFPSGADGAGDSGGRGGASTQDLLRVLWCWGGAAPEAAAAAGPGAERARVLLQAVLDLEARPRDEAAAADALARAGTPGREVLEAFHERLASGRDAKRAAAAEAGGGRGPREGRRAELAAELAARHRQRLLLAAPFRALRERDWFCGQCSAHNFPRGDGCRRCGVPRASLGSSTVTADDVRELEALGVTGPGGARLPPLQAMAAAEAAGAVFGAAAREAIEAAAARGDGGIGGGVAAGSRTAGDGGAADGGRPREAPGRGRGRGPPRAAPGRGRDGGGARQADDTSFGDDEDDAGRYIRQLAQRGGGGGGGGRRAPGGGGRSGAGRGRDARRGGRGDAGAAPGTAPPWARLFEGGDG
jgi:hypothetical protein